MTKFSDYAREIIKELGKDILPGMVKELRIMAEREVDVPELVDYILTRLELPKDQALFFVLAYFREAFCLSLPDALPLWELLFNNDRSEIDSVTIPMMKYTKRRWQPSIMWFPDSNFPYRLGDMEDHPKEAFQLLQEEFPGGNVRKEKFVLFSMSEISPHNHKTLERVEQDLNNEEKNPEGFEKIHKVSFMMIDPHHVQIIHGYCQVTKENLLFLKKLRDSSLKLVTEMGLGEQK